MRHHNLRRQLLAILARFGSKRLSVRAIWAFLILFFGLCQSALWQFLGLMPAAIYFLALVSLVVLILCVAPELVNVEDREASPTAATFLNCFLFSLALFTLGGEGRFFYSNIDWQVRFAVIRDLAINPWPFTYLVDGELTVLRAPLGMFFVPALAWKAWGSEAADYVLLGQNTLLLALLLSLASTLFSSARERTIALAIMTMFSGLDIIGRLVTGGTIEHLENWGATQYSANITLAFWVPNHALPGWIGAAGFLMWYRGKWPLAAFLAPLPFLAIWSPLALMGLLPFASLAVVRTLSSRGITPKTFALLALPLLIALPSFAYLITAGDTVGIKPYPINFREYILFEAIEFLPFFLPLGVAFLIRKNGDGVLLAVICLVLAGCPLVKLGPSFDFAMRVSIPALAILAYLVALELLEKQPIHTVQFSLLLSLVIGCSTGFTEILRSLRHPAAPPILCSVVAAYDESFSQHSKSTYIAPLDKFPSIIRPTTPATSAEDVTTRCWSGDWYHPSGA